MMEEELKWWKFPCVDRKLLSMEIVVIGGWFETLSTLCIV